MSSRALAEVGSGNHDIFQITNDDGRRGVWMVCSQDYFKNKTKDIKTKTPVSKIW